MVSKTEQNQTSVKADREPYATLKKRLEAVGNAIRDPVIDYLTSNAELLYIPKTIQSKNDWLAIKKERGQTFTRYKEGDPSI